MAYLNYNQQSQNNQQQGMNQQQQQGQIPTTGAPAVSNPAPLPMPNQQTQQQQARQSQKGSGQFVNLRGYIQQNQPKAQEISGAVGQNIGQQAQQIGQQVQKQQQDLSARIAENQGRIGEQQQFGQQQIQQALAQEKTGTQNPFSAENLNRFRDIVSGRETFGTVAGLNLAPAQQQFGELSRYTQNVGQAPVRNELLRDTFSKVGQYGTGQRSLDEMLLASSQPAMQSLVEGAKATQQQYANQLQQAQSQAAIQQAALAEAQKAASKGLQEQLTGEQTGIKSAVDLSAQQAKDEVTQLFNRIKSGQISKADAELLGIKQGQILMKDVVDPNRAAAERSLSQYTNQGLRDLTPYSSETRAIAGGTDYQDYLDRIGVSAEDVINEKQLAQSRALAQLAGQTDPYLNANVGGFQKSKEAILGELKQQQELANKSYEHMVKNAVGSQIAADILGLDVGKIDNWDLRFNPYVQYYQTPENVLSARMHGAGLTDPRFSGKIEDMNRRLAQYMDTYRGKINESLGARQAQIVQDGGIIKPRYQRFGRIRGKIK
jgi:hypothetical protein